MNHSVDISEIRNHMFNAHERRYLLSFFLVVGFYFLLVMASLIQIQFIFLLVGFLSFIVPWISGLIRHQSMEYAAKGDKCRRLILYADGLGRDIPPDQLRDCLSWVVGEAVEPAPFDPPYYASTLKPGPARLVDITKESSFFTYWLAKKATTYLSCIIVVIFVSIVATIYFSSAQILNINSAILITAAFLLGGDIYIIKRTYADLSQKAHKTFQHCSNLMETIPENNDDALFEAMNVIEDYHQALISGPPVLYCLYKRHSEELNLAYQAGRQEQMKANRK